MECSSSSSTKDAFVDDDHQDAAAAAPASSASSPSAPNTTPPTAPSPPNRNPIHKFTSRTRDLYTHLTRSEISGSLGDLGTLIPLLVALARQRSVLLAPALFFAGLANVITGYKWDAPMCVQPMKSIAAVALSEGLRRETVTAAGICTGGLIFVIGITNFIEVVNVIVPPNVVSGIQIGVGLRLASKGIQWVADLSWVGSWDCILTALIISVLCLYWLRETPPPSSTDDDDGNGDGGNNNRLLQRQARRLEQLTDRIEDRAAATAAARRTEWVRNCLRRTLDLLTCGLRPKPGQPHPVGIYLFLIGTLFAIIELSTTDNADGQYDLPLTLFGAPVAVWAMDTVTPQDWKVGFLEGAVPQIPLTTLNSVISVCALAHSLYPEKRKSNRDVTKNDAVIGRRECAVSVGLMNLIFCPFGAMPNCHGAGGLAGQHRLGARYGTSVVFLGLAKIFLAVFFGASALTILDAVPTAVLGVMLAIAGQELATTGFTLLVSSVEKEHGDAAAAAAEEEGDDDNEEGVDGRRQDGTRRRRRRRMMTRSKKLMLRQSTVIATITAMVTVALGKTSYGALSGWVAHMVYGDGTVDLIRWCRQRWGRRGRRWRYRAASRRGGDRAGNSSSLDYTSGVGSSERSGSRSTRGGDGGDNVEEGTEGAPDNSRRAAV